MELKQYKKWKLLAIALLFSIVNQAQVKIGGTTAPKDFSVLELISQYKTGIYGGLQLPRLTEGQKAELETALLADASLNPQGITIYNLTSRCVETWNGTSWIGVCGCPDIAAPTGNPSQKFCNEASVADLLAVGTDIKWYNAGGTLLPSNSNLVNNTKYYASQTINTCESTNRLEVTVTIVPTPTLVISAQTFCDESLVSQLPQSGGGYNYIWYVNETTQTPLAPTDKIAGTRTNPLTPVNYYVVARDANECYSGRTAVPVSAPAWWTPATDADVATGKAIKDIRDNQYYRIQTFGTAGTWMTENLRYIPGTANGYSFSFANDSQSARSKYYNYPNAETTDNTEALAKAKAFNAHPEYGVLYNWAAAINDASNAAVPAGATDQVASGNAGAVNNTEKRGICPAGWVLPSDKDWNDLEKYIAENPGNYSTNQPITWDNTWFSAIFYRPPIRTINGQALSMRSTICVNGTNPNGTSNIDGTGFNGLLVGYSIDVNGGDYYGRDAYFWSSSNYDIKNSYLRALRSESVYTAGVYRHSIERWHKFSVRCKKL